MMSDSISLPARRGAPFRPHRLRTFNVAPCSDSDSDIQAIVSDENGSTPRYSDDTPRNIGTLHTNHPLQDFMMPSRRTWDSSTKRRQRHPTSEIINDNITVPCHPAKCKCSLQTRSSDKSAKCPKGFSHVKAAPIPRCLAAAIKRQSQLTATDPDHNGFDSDSDNSIMLLTSSFSDPDATPISLRRAPIGDGALSYDWKNHMSNLQNAMTDSGANSMVWCDDITWYRSPVPTWPIAKAQPSFASWCTIIVFAMIIAVVATVIT